MASESASVGVYSTHSKTWHLVRTELMHPIFPFAIFVTLGWAAFRCETKGLGNVAGALTLLAFVLFVVLTQ